MPKTIWTASFGYTRNLPEGMPQVSIARYCPTWWSPRQKLYCRVLAPSAELFDKSRKGLLGPTQWQAPYRAQFAEPRILQDVYDQLPDGCCLLCWEADWGNCHRKEAWHMLHERFGVLGGEYKIHVERGLVSPAAVTAGNQVIDKSLLPGQRAANARKTAPRARQEAQGRLF